MIKFRWEEILIEVRRLNIGDTQKVIDMLVNFRSEKIAEDNVIKFLNDKKNYLVACLNDDKVIGFVLGYELQRYDNQNNMMYVHEVDVLSEYRRQGIGKKIMNELKQICKRKNLCKMFLITRKSNIPAINLYKTTKGKSSNDDDIVFWYESESF